jgi:hypothetical protein
MIILHHINE